MQQLLLSIFFSLVSTLTASAIGWLFVLSYAPFEHKITLLFFAIGLSAILFSLVINLLFFFIRRWDGCIEKLGGATFTLVSIALVCLPAIFFRMVLIKSYQTLLDTFIFAMLMQIAIIGVVATHFLRTKNYDVPKPGKGLKW